MPLATRFRLAALAFLLGISPAATAQQAAAGAKPAGNATAKEPAALEALMKMGEYLRSLKAYQVEAQSTTDVVLDNGQKMQVAQRFNLLVQPPDRLRAEIVSDDGTKFYLFDGNQFTLFARDRNLYATTAPEAETLAQLVDNLYEKYNLDIPLADLILWGRDDSDEAALTSALDLGPTQVDGITVRQYAFRQEGLDWQIWIQLGDFPLPRKYVLTTTSDPARPEHSVILDWNLAPSFNERSFAFEPPEDAVKIIFSPERSASQ